MKNFFALGILILLSVTTHSQSKAIKIGQNMPDYIFPSVINYPKSSLSMNEMKGKIVILDYWFSGCTTCINLFSHMQELQDYFKDKIQIILVNSSQTDNSERVNAIFANIKKRLGYNVTLPISLYDSVICNLFPHRAEPHEVIISPDGKILAITRSDQITKENVQALLDGKKVNFPLKNDFWNRNVPLISYVDEEKRTGVLVNSTLMKYDSFPFEGLVIGPKYNDKEQIIGEDEYFSLIGAYARAHPSFFKGNPQIKYDTKDSVFNISDDPNSTSNLFLYDLNIQPIAQDFKKLDQLYQKSLGEDLDHAFNFSLRKGKAMFPCLIVRTNKNISKSYTKRTSATEVEENLWSYHTATKNHISVYVHKMSIQSIVNPLSYWIFKTVKVIDDSGLKQELDIDFPVGFDFTDKDKLTAFLHGKGLDLTVENRELDCVIVSDKKPGEPTVIN
ncbi:hypothetical protein SAMN05216436_12035 [bacterium A37T11]|nr:hypothetical protein SAMN05216436_12035 [bacterium A37T11]